MSPCSSKPKDIQTLPAGLLHQAVHNHQEALDAWAFCSCTLAVDLSEHMGTKVGSKEVVDDTEAKPIDMVHEDD